MSYIISEYMAELTIIRWKFSIYLLNNPCESQQVND